MNLKRRELNLSSDNFARGTTVSWSRIGSWNSISSRRDIVKQRLSIMKNTTAMFDLQMTTHFVSEKSKYPRDINTRDPHVVSTRQESKVFHPSRINTWNAWTSERGDKIWNNSLWRFAMACLQCPAETQSKILQNIDRAIEQTKPAGVIKRSYYRAMKNTPDEGVVLHRRTCSFIIFLPLTH